MVLKMDRWFGKVAVVTGASSGIGAAIAEALIQNGLTVVGIARRIERIQGKHERLHGFQADLTKEEDILAAFKWVTDNLGPVHILVNNAGYAQESLLSTGETDLFKKILDLNVLALCIATREAVKIMQENNINGHIVHINSILGHDIRGINKVNVYPASKFAVTALTETLRQELVSLGSRIKVTSISPGAVLTEMTLLREDASEDRRRFWQSRPMLDAEDVADAVVYVLSTPEHVQVHELTIKPVGEPC